MTTEAISTETMGTEELERRIRDAKHTLRRADELWETFTDLLGHSEHTVQEAQGILMILQGLMRRADAILEGTPERDG